MESTNSGESIRSKKESIYSGLKYFLSALLVVSLLLVSTTAFAGTNSTIEAVLGKVLLIVNGKETKTATLVYEGRTYVQLRDTADAIGAKLEWDADKNTASLTTASQTLETPATPKGEPPLPTSTPTKDKALTRTYTVQEGDSLGYISKLFYSTPNAVDKIIKANNITNPNLIKVGDKLIIP